MPYRRAFLTAIAICVALPLLQGCGKSKEQLALERAMNRKRPGFVRLVNFSDVPLVPFNHGRDLDDPVAQGSFSSFRTIAFGKETVSIQLDGKEVAAVQLDMKEMEAKTIVAFGKAPNIQTVVIDGENRKPTAERNLDVRFIDSSGKSFSGAVTLSGDAQKLDLNDRTGGLLVASGNYDLSGTGLTKPMGFEVKNEITYTLLVFRASNDSANVLAMPNNTVEKPMMAGQN